MQEHTVVLYSQGYCEFSEMVRLHLESRGQKYTERDVDADPAARDEMMKLGGTGTPVTVIDGEVVIGYVIINPTGTGNFVGGTTELDDSTVVPNAVFVNTQGAAPG